MAAEGGRSFEILFPSFCKRMTLIPIRYHMYANPPLATCSDWSLLSCRS